MAKRSFIYLVWGVSVMLLPGFALAQQPRIISNLPSTSPPAYTPNPHSTYQSTHQPYYQPTYQPHPQPATYNNLSQLSVWLNKTGGYGYDLPVYYNGEAISITVQPDADAYIYIYFAETAHSPYKPLFPSHYNENNFVKAHQRQTFGGNGVWQVQNSSYTYTQDRIVVIASNRLLSGLEKNSILQTYRTGYFLTPRTGYSYYQATLRWVINATDISIAPAQTSAYNTAQ